MGTYWLPSWTIFADETLPDRRKCILITVASVALALGLKKVISLNSGRKERTVKMEGKESIVNKKALLEERKPSNLWNTAMFFPDFQASEPDSIAQQFLWYFQQARTSIRVCIYNFSFRELEEIIYKQYERGLIVQFIVGQEASAENLRKHSILCGVFPRDCSVLQTDQLMHHKFALIDDEAVLVGSMNWTTEGILNNNENILVSTSPTHVEKYEKEFFRLMSVCEKAKTFH